MGLGCGGEGADSFWAPGIVRRPRRKGRSGFRLESLARRRSRRASQAVVPARARGLQRVARPVQPGSRAQSRRQGQRAPLASFPCPAETRRSGSEARGTRPPARRPRCPGAPLEPSAWRRPPAARPVHSVPRALGIARALRGARELTPFGRRGSRVRGSGPGLRSPRGPKPAGASYCRLSCGGDSSGACGCVLCCCRCASSWRRGEGAFPEVGASLQPGETWIFAAREEPR